MSGGVQISRHRLLAKETLLDVITISIARLVNSSIVSLKMNGEQIKDCAFDIIQDFWMLRLPEVVWVIENIRKRKNYNKLDQSVIFEAFDDYMKERDAIIERAKILEDKQEKEKRYLTKEQVNESYVQQQLGIPLAYQTIEKNSKAEKDASFLKSAEFDAFKNEYLKNKK